MTQLNLMALRHSAFYSPYLMMMAGGYLKQAGFDVNYTTQTPNNLVKDNLLNGNCDVSQSAVAASFTSLEINQPDSIRHFAQINSRDGFFIAGRNASKAFKWDDLINKSVLVDHFFQPMAMFKYALHKKSIDASKLNIIDAGNVENIDRIFRKGKTDYVHQQGPAPQQLEFDGLATVVTTVGDAIGPVAFSSLCATQTWLQSDSAHIFMTLYKQSLNECQNNHSLDIAKQLHAYNFLTNININVLSSTIASYQALGCWNHDGTIGIPEYETLLDVFEYNKLISHRYPYNALIYKIR